MVSNHLTDGLQPDDARRIERGLELVGIWYGKRTLDSGESTLAHAVGLAGIAAELHMDADSRLASLLFSAHGERFDGEDSAIRITAEFGENVAHMVAEVARLNRMALLTRGSRDAGSKDNREQRAQSEVLRKMLLAIVEDIRVVLIRLASRTQTLRYLATNNMPTRREIAAETLDIYAPLANRLGVWQIKWEMEDLSFRILEPEAYTRIAVQLDEKRVEREQYIENVIEILRRETEKAGIQAEILGRPKHIYSIWKKMQWKNLGFHEIYDARAVRLLVADVKECYAALGIVHALWTPIPREFDDYIAQPKGNDYQSLHTAVIGPDGKALEVQIRTRDMDEHAEYGIAAHWRYKEGRSAHKPQEAKLNERIAWLRRITSSHAGEGEQPDLIDQFREELIDETIYVLTPQGRVIDLPRGATPVDFAYALHSELGHRCRGAKVDGAMVPLNFHLQNGQSVEIVTAKQGGPSRDWLNPELGFTQTNRVRIRVRQWFKQLQLEETVAHGRDIVEREMQREGRTGASLEDLAVRLEFGKTEDLFLAVSRGEVNTRDLQIALRPQEEATAPEEEALLARKSKAVPGGSGVLIVGVDKLLTQLARCCKPAPPDAISGYVTRGKGVSIHRASCSNIRMLTRFYPERIIRADWGKTGEQFFPVNIEVVANDRQGLLRDISEVLSREKVNVTAINTLSKKQQARMFFTLEVADLEQLKRMLAMISAVPGVFSAGRR